MTLPPRDGRTVPAYRRRTRPLAFVGGLLLFVGLRFFLDSDAAARATAVGATTHGSTLASLWSLCFVLGGAGVIYGTQRPDPRIERASLVLCVGAVALNGLYLLLVFHTITALLAVLPHIALVAMLLERMWVLTALDRRAAARQDGERA